MGRGIIMTKQSRKTNSQRPSNKSSRQRPAAGSAGTRNYSAKNNSGIYILADGRIANAYAQGRVRDTEKYKERLGVNEKKKFPNKRKRIITGQELTTPLGRKNALEKTQKKTKQKPKIIVETVKQKKKKLPVSGIFIISICAFILTCLILTQIVLYEQTVKLNKLNTDITEEIKKEKNLEMQLVSKNDLNSIIECAVRDYEMIPEELLEKKYIYGKLSDKAEVTGTKKTMQ